MINWAAIIFGSYAVVLIEAVKSRLSPGSSGR